MYHILYTMSNSPTVRQKERLLLLWIVFHISGQGFPLSLQESSQSSNRSYTRGALSTKERGFSCIHIEGVPRTSAHARTLQMHVAHMADCDKGSEWEDGLYI
jgi:hypothetical protein